jgi:hypothetical protein
VVFFYLRRIVTIMSNYGRATTKARKKAESPALSVPIVVGVCVVLLIFLGLLGYHYFGPHTEHLTPHAAGPDESWMKQKAMETQGDFGKLSPADRQEAFRHGGGEAPQTLKMMYQTQKAAQTR